MAFVKATRKQVRLKVAFTGPSGSGKTFSAIQVARGLVGPEGRIAVIDTENGSASLYADLTDFDACEIRPPYTVKKYRSAIDEAIAGGYDALVIDSLSHAWAGDGGLLAKKESLDSRGGNSFANWAGITKEHEELKAAILDAPLHVIATMRSKQDYVLEVGADGKKTTPRKVGLAPVQRDGMEYEFTLVFDVGMNHEAVASKDRTTLFDGACEILTPRHGEVIRQWLDSGAPMPQKAALTVNPAIEPLIRSFVSAAEMLEIPVRNGDGKVSLKLLKFQLGKLLGLTAAANTPDAPFGGEEPQAGHWQRGIDLLAAKARERDGTAGGDAAGGQETAAQSDEPDEETDPADGEEEPEPGVDGAAGQMATADAEAVGTVPVIAQSDGDHAVTEFQQEAVRLGWDVLMADRSAYDRPKTVYLLGCILKIHLNSPARPFGGNVPTLGDWRHGLRGLPKFTADNAAAAANATGQESSGGSGGGELFHSDDDAAQTPGAAGPARGRRAGR